MPSTGSEDRTCTIMGGLLGLLEQKLHIVSLLHSLAGPSTVVPQIVLANVED